MDKGVWVFVEQNRKELKEPSLMLVAEGKKLAGALGQELSAVVIGNDISRNASAIGQYGAEKVMLVQDPKLEYYSDTAYGSVLIKLIKDYRPAVVLFAATSVGRNLAPKVAAALGTGLATNCDAIEVNKQKQMVMTKPIYGGKLSQKIVCPIKKPQMATFLPISLEVVQPDQSKTAEIQEIDLQITDDLIHTKVKGFIKGDPRTIDIADAERIVCTGGGLGDPKHLPILEDLADTLGAAMASSRVGVDKGWLPFQRQIGQTGKTVFPKLIMTFGVSGQIQFTMGMKDSKLIIANDKDRDAPIFKVADIGIVGDLKEIVPALTEELRNKKAAGVK